MDNLLFYILLALLLWYFFYYQTFSPPPPSPKTTSRSTSPIPPTEVKFPSAQSIPETPSSTLTSEDQKLLETTLDQMIKSMSEFSKELDKY